MFKFPSAVKIDGKAKDIAARFFYSDGFFTEDPYTYNPHLATASLCMAMAGFYSNEGETGEGADYSHKNDNIIQYLRDIGVDDKYIDRNVCNAVRPGTDTIGVTIGAKQQPQNNNRWLVIISIRGANYEKEWASNVTLGEGGEAQGFAKAADDVFRFIRLYLLDTRLLNEAGKGNVDFWISGYSRAGATTNLTAKRLVDFFVTDAIAPCKVFAYCNEAPKGGVASAMNPKSNYRCIHNVINKCDLVPYVAPYAFVEPYIWGRNMDFKRYGVDHYIPGTEAGSVKEGDTREADSDNKAYPPSWPSITTPMLTDYSFAKVVMLEHLKAINSNIKFSGAYVPEFGTYGLNISLKALTDSKKLIMYGNYVVMSDYLKELVVSLFTWTNINRDDYVRDLQGSFRTLVSIVFDAKKEQTDLFMERIKKLWDTDVGWTDLAGIFYYALGEWDKPEFKYKKYYTDKIINLLEKNKCFDALELPPAKIKRLKNSALPKIIDFLMKFASVDYRTNKYGTNGLTQVLSLLFNSDNIGMNHYPEVTLAWLRAQDTLYANETSSVTASNVTSSSIPERIANKLNASASNGIITEVADIPDAYVERNEDYKALPSTLAAGTSDGGVTEVSLTWNYAGAEWYSEKPDSPDVWESLIYDVEYAKQHNAQALMGIVKGEITGATLSNDVSKDVTARVFIAELDKLDPPDSSLPDGEYDGPQKVVLIGEGDNRELYYSIAEYTEYDDGSSGGGGDFPTVYTGPITIGEEGLTEATKYFVYAWISSDVEGKADSDPLIWCYNISPVKTEDTESKYVSNTVASNFTLSKDQAFCWRVNKEGITFDGTSAGDSIVVKIIPFNANEVPTKEIHLTAVKVAETTFRGKYKIPVQISTDGGKTWTDEREITFSTEENKSPNDDDDDNGSTRRSRSSSSGCNSGMCALGFALLLILKRKIR